MKEHRQEPFYPVKHFKNAVHTSKICKSAAGFSNSHQYSSVFSVQGKTLSL